RSRKGAPVVCRDLNPELAIISEEQWDWAQRRLTENTRFSKRNRQREYLLSGLIVCGCGGRFQGHMSVNAKGVEYLHYLCGIRIQQAKHVTSDGRTCGSRTLSAPELDAHV